MRDQGRYEPGAPATGRAEEVGQSVQDQWKDMVYMDCYKI